MAMGGRVGFRSLIFIAALIFAMPVAMTPAWSAEVTGDERIIVEYPPNLSPLFARNFANLLASERPRVREWWSGTFEDNIRVQIIEERRIPLALVPAWRGDRGVIIIPLSRVRGNNAASIHELVHIYAPNANRFLAEALAVYAQEHLKGQRAHPNSGRDLHDMASEVTRGISLTELDTVPTPRSLGRDAEPVGAYVAAGSFVRFLIEREGFEKFRALYDLTPMIPGERDAGSPDRWQPIYVKPLSDLEQEWRQFLREHFPPRPAARSRN